jgi:hypothetical protein
MGWVRRLLGIPEAGGTVAVRIPADLAEALAQEAGDEGLDDAVARLVRAHLGSAGHPARAADGRMPFWLSRRDAPPADFESELRDRMAQRRTGDAEDGDGAPPRRPPSSRPRRTPLE